MTGGIEAPEEFLCQQSVGDARGSREVIEREAEATIDVGLDRVLTRGILGDQQSRRLSCELGGCAVFVRTAEKQHLVRGLPAKTRMDVGRQERTHEIYDIFYASGVWTGAGDQ